MHELGLAEGIMTVAIDMSGERPVNRIVVRIGEEQRIVPDSLEFGFQLLAEGTACEGAVLQCIVVPGIEVLVDEVELGGDPPTILRRPGAPVVERPHVHEHTGHNGAIPAPATSAHTPGGI
jgi:Hydrogenase/urease nickel incorporation, metallochaperone, hypA